MVSSYNKRRPIQAMLKTERIDIASMDKARAFEWVGEPYRTETTDARREYFGAVIVDGVSVKVSACARALALLGVSSCRADRQIGDGLKTVDSHGKERCVPSRPFCLR
jgi:hypothetical protein